MTFSEALEEMKKGKHVTISPRRTSIISYCIHHDEIYLCANKELEMYNPSIRSEDILSNDWEIAP